MKQKQNHSPPPERGRVGWGSSATRFSWDTAKVLRAKKLRQNETDAEKLLWSNQLGVSFRRQHSIGKYILDFYCSSKKLAIEVDGGQHNFSENQKQVVKTLRFWNNQVLQEIDGVLQAIYSALHPTPTLTLPLSGVRNKEEFTE